MVSLLRGVAVAGLALAMVATVGGVASAQVVVYDNGLSQRGLTNGKGIGIASVPPGGGIGVSFVLGSDANLTTAQFSFATYTGQPASVNPFLNWIIYTDDGNLLPGVLSASGSGTTSGSIGVVSLDLPSISVPANQRFWFIINQTNVDPSNRVYWNNTNNCPANAVLGVVGAPGHWSHNLGVTDSDYYCYGELPAFALLGTPSSVPEPSSIALLGTGLLGLVPIVRRRKRQVDR